jgi:hypothetical protein
MVILIRKNGAACVTAPACRYLGCWSWYRYYQRQYHGVTAATAEHIENIGNAPNLSGNRCIWKQPMHYDIWHELVEDCQSALLLNDGAIPKTLW